MASNINRSINQPGIHRKLIKNSLKILKQVNKEKLKVETYTRKNIALTAADAQDAGGSYFEHILLCTTSVAFGHWASLVSVSGTYGA